jgi:hypothetical protein
MVNAETRSDCFNLNMATKVRNNEAGLRKITKPVISSDVMGNRNVEVRAVGAWVQAEPPPRRSEAVVSLKCSFTTGHYLLLKAASDSVESVHV